MARRMPSERHPPPPRRRASPRRRSVSRRRSPISRYRPAEVVRHPSPRRSPHCRRRRGQRRPASPVPTQPIADQVAQPATPAEEAAPADLGAPAPDPDLWEDDPDFVPLTHPPRRCFINYTNNTFGHGDAAQQDVNDQLPQYSKVVDSTPPPAYNEVAPCRPPPPPAYEAVFPSSAPAPQTAAPTTTSTPVVEPVLLRRPDDTNALALASAPPPSTSTPLPGAARPSHANFTAPSVHLEEEARFIYHQLRDSTDLTEFCKARLQFFEFRARNPEFNWQFMWDAFANALHPPHLRRNDHGLTMREVARICLEAERLACLSRTTTTPDTYTGRLHSRALDIINSFNSSRIDAQYMNAMLERSYFLEQTRLDWTPYNHLVQPRPSQRRPPSSDPGTDCPSQS